MTAELVWVIPFILLLLSIAILPFINKRWWEKNYAWIAFGFAAVVVWHYLFQLKNTHSLLSTGHEYFSFITLIGALFVVAGGIHINVKGEATPLVNSAFLLIGAVLANFLGTTGASMVLIRPWVRMNKYRFTGLHIVFFIFLVSNIGGGLTPIGDPPLFLGYLKGVPFFWVLENVWPIWLTTVSILILIFYVMDSVNFKRAPFDIRVKETSHKEEWRFLGMHNVFFLLMIIAAVFINNPPFLREALMLLAALLSYKTTPKAVHERNDFNFGPMKEVAILFLGIFATMIPALEWLELNAAQIGISTAGQFYWGSGCLSAVLDNAPTYLNFLSAIVGLFSSPATASAEHGGRVYALLTTHPEYIRAISVSTVFFGSMTYIGNGPNFLVKSITEQSKIKAPSFFGYLFKYSLPILLPIFAGIWFLFFRG